ncbi:competence protein ComK [Virgibacillus xinjiangensis]|uniref:Competence protein ComK n=1 Tax=Virgibacillus xinjiangensis TaxID=393090 RepID=A0ABV7CW09_9BACI
MYKDFYTPSYEISPLTMAVIANPIKKGETYSYVLEEEMEYAIDNSPSRLMNDACKYLGSSLKGRQDGTREICGITHKAPISVDPSCGMYFFPTTSPANPKCSWIAHTHIDQINRIPDNSTEIIFHNGKKITLKVSYGSMLNQVQRTAQFRYLLDQRIKYLQKHAADLVAEPQP